MKFLIPALKGPRLFSMILGLSLSMSSPLLTGCGSESTGPAVVSNAQIEIILPRGGETYLVGSVVDVKWRLRGKGFEDVNSVTIELSPDSGITWINILLGSIGTNDPTWGTYRWNVPASVEKAGKRFDLVGGPRLLFRIMQYTTGNPNQIAVLEKPFSIVSR